MKIRVLVRAWMRVDEHASFVMVLNVERKAKAPYSL